VFPTLSPYHIDKFTVKEETSHTMSASCQSLVRTTSTATGLVSVASALPRNDKYLLPYLQPQQKATFSDEHGHHLFYLTGNVFPVSTITMAVSVSQLVITKVLTSKQTRETIIHTERQPFNMPFVWDYPGETVPEETFTHEEEEEGFAQTTRSALSQRRLPDPIKPAYKVGQMTSSN